MTISSSLRETSTRRARSSRPGTFSVGRSSKSRSAAYSMRTSDWVRTWNRASPSTTVRAEAGAGSATAQANTASANLKGSDPFRFASTRVPLGSCRLVDRDDGGTAETDVVLEGRGGALHLAGIGVAAQLPGELAALGEAGRAEGVALGDQAARRVHHRAVAPVGGRLRLDEPVAMALLRETQGLVGDELVRREAIVQLADVDLFGGHARLLVGFLGRLL